jgi:3-oxoacyl-[acyl-carrier protein] reductase
MYLMTKTSFQKPFSHQVAIITGAGVGIGYEIAQQLAYQGASVILNDVDEHLATQAAQKISDNGGICEAYTGDVSQLSVIQQLLAYTISKFGQVNILIANAGITTFGDFLTYEPASMQQILQVNLFGTFFLTQAVAQQLIKQHSGGSILLTSSVTGHQAHKNLAAYGMTKAGIQQLAKNLVIDLSPHQININSIAPGATLTERTLSDAEYINTWSKITPTGRPSTVEDIANAALFLVSPLSRQITGQCIVIDGGWSSLSPSPYQI